MFKLSLKIILLLVIIPVYAASSSKDDPLSITILILNQHHHLHEQKALKLMKSIQTDATPIKHLTLDVQIGSLSFPHLPYWTFFPLLEQFQNSKSDWFVLINEFSTVNLDNLVLLLAEKVGSSFIGRSLSDSTPSALHHYASSASVPWYPDTRAGIVLSAAAFKSAASKYDPSINHATNQFVIDPGYEFAKWLLEESSVKLEHSTRLCVDGAEEGADKLLCAVTTAARQLLCQPSVAVGSQDVGLHVAVKTYSGHHESRLPVLRQTWLTTAHSYTLYSDVTDPVAGTLSSGVANTERGHCAKTLSILAHALDAHQTWRWLVVADDDTLLSIERLSGALSCYDPAKPLALGEVYGYRISDHQLLPYQTGGSGMIFSREMVTTIVASPWCTCRSADEPDDMLLGMCLNRLGHAIIHLHDMHQNNPPNYSFGRLSGSYPISFHNFWMVEPVQVYNNWLYNAARGHKEQDEERKPMKSDHSEKNIHKYAINKLDHTRLHDDL